MAWNDGLNPESSVYKFASDESKIIRVVAGPGTGKSFGLRRRVARLIEGGQDPKRILAVTFTRTAAQDLKKEIDAVGVEGADKVIAKTLHSFCFGLLRKNDIIESTGRYPRPMLDFEQKPMLYDIEGSFGSMDEKREKIRAFEAAWARLQSEEPGFPLSDSDREFQKQILQWLQTHKSMMFGEMIIEAYHYLRNNPLCAERHEFDHVLVDEYQDLNKAEQAVIDLLSADNNIAIIGDDDQSIYSFKYANPEGIREFPYTHPGCDIIDFDQCRRCPKQVVNMASRLISHNSNRTLGDLHSFDKNQDGIVKIVQWKSLADEISGICSVVDQEIKKNNIRPEDVLILAPVRKIGYQVRDELVKKGINAKSYFRETAIGTDELKHNFSLLSLAANREDRVSLRYLLGERNATFCAAGYKHLLQFAQEHEVSIEEALDGCVAGHHRIPYANHLVQRYKEIKKELDKFLFEVSNEKSRILDLLSNSTPENTVFRNILCEAIENTPTDELTVDEWLKEIYSFALERISFPEDTADLDHVRIMSLHASKGLSAKYVIIMSAIDDLIPRIVPNSEISKEQQIEEQRRLFYVAITRCKSSDHEYPGSLIISSFVGLPGSEALGMNIPARPNTWKNTSMTRFIRDFEETAPKPTII